VLGITRVLVARPAELGSSAGIDLLVHRVIWLALDNLARGKAEGLGSGTPPAAGCFAGLGGVDAVPAGHPLNVAILSLPDVAEVVTLGDGDDYGQAAALVFTSLGRPAATAQQLLPPGLDACRC
jgi:hypothetical protein